MKKVSGDERTVLFCLFYIYHYLLMTNILVYYFAILVPFGGLIRLKQLDLVSPTVFLLLFLFYFLVYRTWTDGTRLRQKKLISKKEALMLVLPGRRLKYLKDLYLT